MFGEVRQFTLGSLQRFDLVAKDPFRRLLDPLLQTINSRSGLFLSLLRFGEESGAEELRRGIKCLIGLHLARRTDRVVELLRQQWLGGFGLFDDGLGGIDEFVRLLTLLLELGL